MLKCTSVSWNVSIDECEDKQGSNSSLLKKSRHQVVEETNDQNFVVWKTMVSKRISPFSREAFKVKSLQGVYRAMSA